VTLVPEQIAPEGTAAMVTLATTDGVTDIAIAFEVAGLALIHGALEVITQVMLFPLAKPASE
jgi:hypothetical protein